MITKPRLECPADLVSLLGTEYDHQIAARAGVSTPIARRWRVEAGHPPRRGPPEVSLRGEALTPEATECALSALPGCGWADRARRIGVSRQAVSWARAHGLSRATLEDWSTRARAAPLPPELPWSPDEIARMGVGVEPDEVIAAREGVSAAQVAAWRLRVGLPSPTRGAPKMSPEATVAALEVERVRLGCASLAELAQRMGLTPGALCNWRKRGTNQATIQRYVARIEPVADNADASTTA